MNGLCANVVPRGSGWIVGQPEVIQAAASNRRLNWRLKTLALGTERPITHAPQDGGQ